MRTFPINPKRQQVLVDKKDRLVITTCYLAITEEKGLQSHPVPVHRCGSSKVKVIQTVPLLRSALAGTKGRFVIKEDILSATIVRTQPLLFGRVLV